MSESLISLLDAHSITNETILNLVYGYHEEMNDLVTQFKEEVLNKIENSTIAVPRKNLKEIFYLDYENSWWLNKDKNQIKISSYSEAKQLKWFSLVNIKCDVFILDITGFPDKPGVCIITFPLPHLFYFYSEYRKFYQKITIAISKMIDSTCSMYFRSNSKIYGCYLDKIDVYDFADGTSPPVNDFFELILKSNFELLDIDRNYDGISYEKELSSYFFENNRPVATDASNPVIA